MSGYGPPAASRPPASPEQRASILRYVGAGLGAIAFVWGFIDWISNGDGTVGYATTGTGAIACLLLSGAAALAEALERKPASALPGALAGAGVLLTLGILVSFPDGYDVGAGIILALVTSILQAVVLVLAWLMATGRMRVHSATGAQGYGGPGYGPPAGYGAPPPGYGPPPQQGPPPNYPQPQQGPPPGYTP